MSENLPYCKGSNLSPNCRHWPALTGSQKDDTSRGSKPRPSPPCLMPASCLFFDQFCQWQHEGEMGNGWMTQLKLHICFSAQGPTSPWNVPKGPALTPGLEPEGTPVSEQHCYNNRGLSHNRRSERLKTH